MWTLNHTKTVVGRDTRAASFIPSIHTNPQPQRDSKIVKDIEAEALKHHDYFNIRGLVKLEDLFEARCHLGHKSGCRNPYMAPYLFGTRMDIDIIDLEKTVPHFQDALNFVAHIAYRKGIILFVSRNKMSTPWVEKVAKDCEEYAHCRYWRPETFLDPVTAVGQAIRLPDLVIFLSTMNSIFDTHSAVIHANKLLIPTVGIVDTGSNPQLITYPIPGNDDSPVAIKYYLKLFEKVIKTAKERRKADEN